VKGHWA